MTNGEARQGPFFDLKAPEEEIVAARGGPPDKPAYFITVRKAARTLVEEHARLTREEWAALEKAALALIDAAKINAVGGTGPMDKAWAAEPAWKPFNDAMVQASQAALTAIRAKNHEALLAAGDQLYPPCEGCHMLFNPGVVNQN